MGIQGDNITSLCRSDCTKDKESQVNKQIEKSR